MTLGGDIPSFYDKPFFLLWENEQINTIHNIFYICILHFLFFLIFFHMIEDDDYGRWVYSMKKSWWKLANGRQEERRGM
jgi:hypothetical protein